MFRNTHFYIFDSEKYRRKKEIQFILSNIQKKRNLINKKTAFKKLKNNIYNYKLKHMAFIILKSYYFHKKVERKEELYAILWDRFNIYRLDIPYSIERWINDD